MIICLPLFLSGFCPIPLVKDSGSDLVFTECESENIKEETGLSDNIVADVFKELTLFTYSRYVRKPLDYYLNDYLNKFIDLKDKYPELSENLFFKRLKLTQHLKMLMADVSHFNASDSVVLPTISQPSSSDLVYYNVSENGKKVKMEIYSGTIADVPIIFSCYVPVCDSTNTTAVPSDFIINKTHNVGVRTMMGNLNLSKVIETSNNSEQEVDIVALPQDNQLVDIDGKRYMLIRFTFWYDLTGQLKDNMLQYSDSYKVYLMFEN